MLRLCSRAHASSLLLGACFPDDARTFLLLLILLALYGASGAAETVLRGAIIAQGFVSGGQSATEQRSGISSASAVAAQPADAPAQSRVTANHRHVVEASQSVAMEMQVPCAPGAAAHQHEFQRRFLSRQNKAKSRARGCASQHGVNVSMVLRADAVQVAAVRIACLCCCAERAQQSETKDEYAGFFE